MTIVVATGGTGGHIFPALQTACVLRDHGHKVVFVGTLGVSELKVKNQGFETVIIQAQGLTSRSLQRIVMTGIVMVRAISEAMKVLRQQRPDKVIGFGGYGSFAVVCAARFLNIPVMIHEQNVMPGKANRFLARFVKKIAISFQDASTYFDSKKIIWTGCPCHQELPAISRENVLKKLSLDSSRKTIVVLGGSQGSQKINEAFYEMISLWEDHQSIQVIHMTGSKEFLLYTEKYKNFKFPVRVADFLNPIEEIYSIADVVIARSGAATVSELGFFAIPSVFIPYPLADGHQRYNAEVLTNLGLSKIIDQKDLTASTLKSHLKEYLSDPFDREGWKKRTKNSFKQFPANELAIAVENL